MNLGGKQGEDFMQRYLVAVKQNVDRTKESILQQMQHEQLSQLEKDRSKQASSD